MKVVAASPQIQTSDSEVETVVLSQEQLDFLRKLSSGVNPDMPMAFGGPHVIRTLLERIEEADIDLSDATSEEELTRIAANGLR